MVRKRDRCIQRQGYLDIAIVLKAMVLCPVLLFHRRILFLIFFEPNLKLAFPGIPVPTRITQSCRFLPMIDLAFGLAFPREYFLQRSAHWSLHSQRK